MIHNNAVIPAKTEIAIMSRAIFVKNVKVSFIIKASRKAVAHMAYLLLGHSSKVSKYI